MNISAEFNQGDNIIYSTDSLDILKQYLTVTAQKIDRTEIVPSTDYILSGSLTRGLCSITVSYSGKIATFDVITRAGTLPSGYTEVKYIRSVYGSNKTYIDTNYQIDKDKTILYIDHDRMGTYTKTGTIQPVNWGLFCANGGSGSPWKGMNGLGYYMDYGFTPGYGAADLGYIGDGYEGKETEFNYPLKYIKNRTTGATYTITADYGTPPSTYSNVLIFARRGYGTMPGAQATAHVSDLKVYNAKIIEDGAMVRDFVPCIRESDGAVGMYDVAGSISPLTNTSFYPNAGSGEFTYEAL